MSQLWAIKHSQDFSANPYAYLRISLEGRCEIFTTQSHREAIVMAGIVAHNHNADLKVVPYEPSPWPK